MASGKKLTRPVNQLIGRVARVARAGNATVVDYTGTVKIFDGIWRTGQNIKFVLTPAASAADTALLAAAIRRRLELAGPFQQDPVPGTTVRAASITNIIVG